MLADKACSRAAPPRLRLLLGWESAFWDAFHMLAAVVAKSTQVWAARGLGSGSPPPAWMVLGVHVGAFLEMRPRTRVWGKDEVGKAWVRLQEVTGPPYLVLVDPRAWEQDRGPALPFTVQGTGGTQACPCFCCPRGGVPEWQPRSIPSGWSRNWGWGKTFKNSPLCLYSKAPSPWLSLQGYK